MSDIDINKVQQNIKELQDQNAIDFQQWKKLGQDIEKLTGNIKITDSHLNLLMKKIKADYEALRKIIVDKNVQVQLNNKIEKNESEINKKVNKETFNNSMKSINEQMSKKASKEDVARISSGTPLFASSTTGMTDTTRNYVNTNDGYLYNYNGESWAKTDVLYQSTGIEKDSVTPTMIKDGVEFNNLYNYYYNCVDGSYITSTGEIVPNENGSYAKIPVTPLTKFSIFKPSAKYDIESGAILFLNKSGNKVDLINGTAFINGKYNDINYITISIPNTTTHVLFNVRLTDYDDRFTTIVEMGEQITIKETQITKIFNKKIKDEELTTLFNEFIKSINLSGKNLYNFSTDYMPNKLCAMNGALMNSDGWGVAQIKVKGNTTYSLYMPSGIYTDDIGTIPFYNGTTIISYITGSNYINGQYNGVNYITFTTPENTNLIYVTCKRPSAPIFDNRETLKIFESGKIDDNIFNEYIIGIDGHSIKNNETNHPLKGKKWGFIGDSLTEKNSRTLKNYIDYITEASGIIPVNLGVSGTGYKKGEDSNNAFYQRVQSIDNDFDIITIFGSGNDLSLPLGNVTDNTTSTVFGCVNETIKRIYSKMPTVKLGIISPTPWIDYPNYTDGNSMQLLSNGLKEICKRGSIPFLDLYNCSNLRPWDETFRTLMYSKDEGNGVHPDENGHKQFYRKILKFGESL